MDHSNGKHPKAAALGFEPVDYLSVLYDREEAQVPLAMADAFKSGNLGVMDYARYHNIQSDTEMRRSLSQPEQSSEEQ